MHVNKSVDHFMLLFVHACKNYLALVVRITFLTGVTDETKTLQLHNKFKYTIAQVCTTFY